MSAIGWNKRAVAERSIAPSDLWCPRPRQGRARESESLHYPNDVEDHDACVRNLNRGGARALLGEWAWLPEASNRTSRVAAAGHPLTSALGPAVPRQSLNK